MKISSYIYCFILGFSLSVYATSGHATTNPEDKQSAKIMQLEQRIVELESLVQLLLKQSKLPSSLKPTEHDLSTKIASKVNANQQVINQKAIATNTAELSNIAEMAEQAEMAIYSYEDLSEEINNSIKISGYADVEYKGSGEDGVNEQFRMHHLSLFFTKQFDNKIKFFSEIEYEDTPKLEGKNDGSGDLKLSSGKIFVEAVNFDWNYSQHFNLRAGRFFTPAGIWSEDHYPPFVPTQERPLHIRKIFPQLVDGLSLFGSTEFVPNHFFNYTSFIGNGESNVSGKKDLNSSKAVGFKGDYHAPWLDDFTLGFTLYNDNNDSSNNEAEKFSYGYHLKFRHEKFTVQTEYAKADLHFDNTLEDYKSEGYYSQFLYQFDQWGLGYRFDVFTKNDTELGKIKRNSVFINYHLNEKFTLKGEFHQDSQDELMIEDYSFYIFSITGYLGK